MNVSARGGGLILAGYRNGSVIECTFDGCFANGSQQSIGGGLCIGTSQQAEVLVSDSSFVGCYAGYAGGGVIVAFSVKFSITNTSFSNCESIRGSGAAIYIATLIPNIISNVTFFNNRVPQGQFGPDIMFSNYSNFNDLVVRLDDQSDQGILIDCCSTSINEALIFIDSTSIDSSKYNSRLSSGSSTSCSSTIITALYITPDGSDTLVYNCSSAHPCRTLYLTLNRTNFVNAKDIHLSGGMFTEEVVSNMTNITRRIHGSEIFGTVTDLSTSILVAAVNNVFWVTNSTLDFEDVEFRYESFTFFYVRNTGKIRIYNCFITKFSATNIITVPFVRVIEDAAAVSSTMVTSIISFSTTTLSEFIFSNSAFITVSAGASIVLGECAFGSLTTIANSGFSPTHSLLVETTGNVVNVAVFLSISNCTFTSISTQSSRGCLATIRAGNGSDVVFLNVSVEELEGNGQTTSGGVLSVVTAHNVTVTNCGFHTLNNILDGGGFHIEDCLYISFSYCYFNICSVTGNGGAISIGENSLFSIVDCNFSHCSAQGFGGALSFNSTRRGNRELRNCVFILNSAAKGGSDIAEVTSESETSSLFYSLNNFVNISSSSSSPLFFFLIDATTTPPRGFNRDCLIFGNCTDTSYHINGATGNDDSKCGSSSLPCKTFDYVFTTTESSGNYISITFEVENQYNHSIRSISLTDRSIVLENRTFDGDLSILPNLKPVSFSSGERYLFRVGLGGRLGLYYVKIYHLPSNVASGPLLLIYGGGWASLDGVNFLADGTTVYSSFVVHDGGGSACHIADSILKGFNFNNADGLFRFNGGEGTPGTFTLLNVLVEDVNLTGTGNGSLVFQTSNTNSEFIVNITGSTFKSNRIGGSTEAGGLFYFFTSQLAEVHLINNNISNITIVSSSVVRGGVISLTNNITRFSIEGCSFINITGATSGGALYKNINVVNSYSQIANTIFDNCSVSGNGGAVFIHRTAQRILSVTFRQNTAGGNGLDVYLEDKSQAEQYETGTYLVVFTCSESFQQGKSKFYINGFGDLDMLFPPCSNMDGTPVSRDESIGDVIGGSGTIDLVLAYNTTYNESITLNNQKVYIDNTVDSYNAAITYNLTANAPVFTATDSTLNISYCNLISVSYSKPFILLSNSQLSLVACNIRSGYTGREEATQQITSPIIEVSTVSTVVNLTEVNLRNVYFRGVPFLLLKAYCPVYLTRSIFSGDEYVSSGLLLLLLL
jgi:hypothetical protein